MKYTPILAIPFILILTVPTFAAQELPAPTGPYGVGRTLTYATNDDRPEIWTDDPNDHRHLPLCIWYPADVKHGSELAPYLPCPQDKIRGALAIERGRGRVLITHTYDNTPVAKQGGAFPIILFSAGSGSSPANYHSLIEDLVSHGYVVVGMDHPYEGAGQVNPEGTLIPPTNENLKPDTTDEPGTDAYRKASRALYIRRVNDRAADAKTALDTLAFMNKDKRGKLAGRLDMNRVGVLGHSMGGNTAAHALTDVPAIKSGINLDGHADSMPFDDKHVAQKPFMCVEAPNAPPTDEKLAEWNMTRDDYDKIVAKDNEMQAAAYRKNPTVSYRLTIKGAEHGSFGDETYPMPEREGMTRADRERYTAIARYYVRTFFDETLKGENGKALPPPPVEYADITTLEAFGAGAK